MVILVNKAKCLHCGDVVVSKDTHDFEKCKCEALSIGGGFQVLRRSFQDPTKWTEQSEVTKFSKGDVCVVSVDSDTHDLAVGTTVIILGFNGKAGGYTVVVPNVDSSHKLDGGATYMIDEEYLISPKELLEDAKATQELYIVQGFYDGEAIGGMSDVFYMGDDLQEAQNALTRERANGFDVLEVLTFELNPTGGYSLVLP